MDRDPVAQEIGRCDHGRFVVFDSLQLERAQPGAEANLAHLWFQPIENAKPLRSMVGELSESERGHCASLVLMHPRAERQARRAGHEESGHRSSPCRALLRAWSEGEVQREPVESFKRPAVVAAGPAFGCQAAGHASGTTRIGKAAVTVLGPVAIPTHQRVGDLLLGLALALHSDNRVRRRSAPPATGLRRPATGGERARPGGDRGPTGS